MSSSGESSDSQVVHIIQPSVSVGASSVTTEEKTMQSSGGAVVCPVGGASHLIMGGGVLPSHHDPSPQPDSASSSPSSPQQYTVEEQVTTFRVPMRRPNYAFLEILHEVGASGEVFTMGEIIHHVKNYIIKHQLYDHADPRVVHCGNHELGRVFGVDQFTINEAVPLFMKHTFAVPDSCIRIRRQLVKKAVDSSGAASGVGVHQHEGGGVTSTVTSTTGSEGGHQSGATASGVRGEGHSSASSASQTSPGCREKGEGSMYESSRRTSVNIEYGDEVDGAAPLFQVNMATNSQSAQTSSSQAYEEDSVSVQYDSDHFAVEYELDSSDHRSESEHSSHSTVKDFVVVQKESDVEFWADYSETETNSDTELGDADLWQCEVCQTSNVPFYRNCSKCWALRSGWLPDSSLLPSSSSSPPLPKEPRGPQHPYEAPSSNDEQLGSGPRGMRWWRLPDKVRRRRVRVMSASSSERSSESLVSLSDDDDVDVPGMSGCGGGDHSQSMSTSGEGREDSGVSSVAHMSSQELASSQETLTADSSSQNQSVELPQDSRRRGVGGGGGGGGGKMKGGKDMCMVCASRPKTGCIIHGSSGHQMCCYRCAKRLWRKGQPCPLCRRPIQKVIKNFVL